jgi:hypothetical protein
VLHQYAFQHKSLAAVLAIFRSGKLQVKEATASTAGYIAALSSLAQRWRVRWSGPAPICEFDFRSAGSTFNQRGEAEVLEKTRSNADAGTLALAVDVPRQLQAALSVRFAIGGGSSNNPAVGVCSASSRIKTTPSSIGSWEASLKQAQLSLFAQELFTTLNREARQLAWTAASIANDHLHLTVGSVPTLHIALTADKGSVEVEPSTSVVGPHQPQPTLIMLAAQMLLRIQHRKHTPSGVQARKVPNASTHQANQPPAHLLQKTMAIHTSRQTIRKVGHILHAVAANIAIAMPEVRVVVHGHITGPSERTGYTVHLKREQRAEHRNSFMLLVNGTGVDLHTDERDPQHGRWLAASIDALQPAILAFCKGGRL